MGECQMSNRIITIRSFVILETLSLVLGWRELNLEMIAKDFHIPVSICLFSWVIYFTNNHFSNCKITCKELGNCNIETEENHADFGFCYPNLLNNYFVSSSMHVPDSEHSGQFLHNSFYDCNFNAHLTDCDISKILVNWQKENYTCFEHYSWRKVRSHFHWNWYW